MKGKSNKNQDPCKSPVDPSQKAGLTSKSSIIYALRKKANFYYLLPRLVSYEATEKSQTLAERASCTATSDPKKELLLPAFNQESNLAYQQWPLFPEISPILATFSFRGTLTIRNTSVSALQHLRSSNCLTGFSQPSNGIPCLKWKTEEEKRDLEIEV